MNNLNLTHLPFVITGADLYLTFFLYYLKKS